MLYGPTLAYSTIWTPQVSQTYLQHFLIFKKTSKKNFRCSGLCPILPLVSSPLWDDFSLCKLASLGISLLTWFASPFKEMCLYIIWCIWWAYLLRLQEWTVEYIKTIKNGLFRGSILSKIEVNYLIYSLEVWFYFVVIDQNMNMDKVAFSMVEPMH